MVTQRSPQSGAGHWDGLAHTALLSPSALVCLVLLKDVLDACSLGRLGHQSPDPAPHCHAVCCALSLSHGSPHQTRG